MVVDPRIAPPHDLEDFLTELTENIPNYDFPMFGTKQKALMFAAALGKFLGVRTPIERRGTQIRMAIFSRALDEAFVNALAVVEDGELQVLHPERVEERVLVFEEYTHTGLKRMQQEWRSPGDKLQAMIRLTEKARQPVEKEVDGVDADILADLMR